MNNLQEVLISGEGIERPFRCHEHDDHSASASVNVSLGVWVCYACGAAGRVDGKKAPEADELLAMLEPERACRVYSEAYLELFANDMGNFAERFPPWLRYHAGLGCDPLTMDATFPVRTPQGQLAGVGHRRSNPAENEGRYAYPRRWSAARSLFLVGGPSDILVLVEGAADASAIAEVGARAAAIYGSGLHAPQIELVMRTAPRLVVLAFDADEAGYRAARGGPTKSGNRFIPGAAELLGPHVETVMLDWGMVGAKDPAEIPPAGRLALLTEIVSGAGYVRDIGSQWTANVQVMQSEYDNRGG